jgi:uncharacterized protein
VKVLIPGGTGLLGTALSAQLLAEGHQVWVLSRNPNPPLVSAALQTALWDGKTATGWGYLVEKMDAIINLAGENIGARRWSQARKEQIRMSRINAGQAICEAVQKAINKPQVLVQASGIGAYGPSGDLWLDETAGYGEDFQSKVCLVWEASTQPVEAMGVRRVVMRTGLVMTRQGGWMQPLTTAYRLYACGPLGSGRQWWSWIHLADYVRGVIHFLNHPETSGTYNLAAPTPVQMDAFGRELARVLHRPYWAPAPGFALKLGLGEMSDLILFGQRVSSQKVIDSGYSYRYATLRPALEDLFG